MWSGGSGSGPQGAQQPQSQDVVDLQDQFEQQQTMISQLKETQHKNQQHLMNKGKQVEEYAAKFSNIKLRSKVSKRGLKRDVPSESTEDDGKEIEEQSIQKKVNTGVKEQLPRSPSTEKTTTPGAKMDKGRQGKLHLLRKKLDKNRMKFEEQRGEDKSDKRIEEMVEPLKSQLNESDRVIKELQKNFESPNISIMEEQPTPSSDEEPTQQIEEIPEEEIAEPNPYQEELYQLENYICELLTIIEGKNHIITGLQGRIESLQNTIRDYQKALKESNQVFDAISKDLTRLSED